jgi:hypothetical protein
MPAFSHQFDQVDPFEPVVQGSLQDWALRAAHGASTMLAGCSKEQMTGWGRMVERELQQLAARHVGEPSPHPLTTGQLMSSPAEVRWQLTDLQLLGELDLEAVSGDLPRQDPSNGSDRLVQLWRLRAVLALWKLADASMLLSRAAGRAKATPLSAAESYAGAGLPKKVARKMATEMVRSLITEAAVAVAWGWEAYRAEMRESQTLWEGMIAEERSEERGEKKGVAIGIEIGAAEQEALEAEKRTARASEAARAGKAETYRAQDLVFKWLEAYPDGHFSTPSHTAHYAKKFLDGDEGHGGEKISPALKKRVWAKKAISGWLIDLAPEELHSRWLSYTPSPSGKRARAGVLPKKRARKL